MSEPRKIDAALQDVADKILAELPEDVSAVIGFKLHEGGDGLVLSYPGNLQGTPEFNDLDAVAKRFGGGFVSRGKDNSFYFIPKPKPKSTEPSVPSAEHLQEPQIEKTQLTEKTQKYVAASAPPIPSATEKVPGAAKSTAQLDRSSDRQLSPMEAANEVQRKREEDAKKEPGKISEDSKDSKDKIFCDSIIREIVSLNVDFPVEELQGLPLGELENLLKVAKNIQRNYTRVLEQAFEKFLPVFDSIAGSLEILAKHSEAKSALPVQPQVSQSQQSTPVHRNTRPIEGHLENGITWINDFNQKGEPIEKAYVKDNERSDNFNALDHDLYDATTKRGKKGLEHNGKWYWLSQNYGTTGSSQDYIGRKAAKEFPKTQGSRRY